MLKPAIHYADILPKLYQSIWFNDKYKYYNYNTTWRNFNVSDRSDDWHEFASVDSQGNVLGLISYYVVRCVPKAQSFGTLSFKSGSVIFGRDLLQSIDDIFVKFGLHKLDFSVVIGNPIEKTYDRLCEKYGGEILCIERDETRLQDNKLYDVKRYTITRENYLKKKSGS